MFHIGTCTHCQKHDLALQVVQVAERRGNDLCLYFHCPNCKHPSCGVGYCGAIRHDQLLQRHASNDELQVRVAKIWPFPPRPDIPEGIPEAAERALLQAEWNFNHRGNEEAAALMYRKTLEVSLKSIDPEIKGTLAARIEELSRSGRLTADIADWADGIRSLGNDGAHETEAIEREELESMRGLTKMVLVYLFTLPEQVRALRKEVSSPA